MEPYLSALLGLSSAQSFKTSWSTTDFLVSHAVCLCSVALCCNFLLRFQSKAIVRFIWERPVSRSARGTPLTKFGTLTKSRLTRYPNIHLGPHLADSEVFRLCCHILSGGKLLPQGQSWEHGLCFTKMKHLPRAVNPGPGWYPPDLEPYTKQAGEHNS